MRGLKLFLSSTFFISVGRTPLGARGLKLQDTSIKIDYEKSHPARGAWIETKPLNQIKNLNSRTPLGVRGLKLVPARHAIHSKESHPARGAWIETFEYLFRDTFS